MDEIKAISTEVWLVFRAYYGKDLKDEDWGKLISGMNEIVDKYKGKPSEKFATQLSMAYLNEIEREYKSEHR